MSEIIEQLAKKCVASRVPHPTVRKENRDARFINLLSKVASDIVWEQQARLAACIVHKNEIVAFGVNESKTHPFQAKFGKNDSSIFLHAETSAIKNALKVLDDDQMSKSTLYVCRVKFADLKRKKLIFGLAKPCDGCVRCIHTFGIQKVIYSLDKEGFAML